MVMDETEARVPLLHKPWLRRTVAAASPDHQPRRGLWWDCGLAGGGGSSGGSDVPGRIYLPPYTWHGAQEAAQEAVPADKRRASGRDRLLRVAARLHGRGAKQVGASAICLSLCVSP